MGSCGVPGTSHGSATRELGVDLRHPLGSERLQVELSWVLGAVGDLQDRLSVALYQPRLVALAGDLGGYSIRAEEVARECRSLLLGEGRRWRGKDRVNGALAHPVRIGRP
ncbi:MAG: hypothetical protein WD830_09895 [Chloroflexota bacterium]